MAGYSGTPLSKKLGIRDGHRVVLLDAPAGFASTLEPLPSVMLASNIPRAGEVDIVVAFVTKKADLIKRITAAHARLAQNGGLWIAWPKKASKVPTDITEDTIREVALPRGLVDNKVCAVDEVWSGLRLVIRKELRAPP
jgi:hypothetical protein